MFDPYSLVLSAAIGFAILCIFAVLLYTILTFKKIDDKIKKQREDIDKLIKYIKFFDKLLFDLVKYIDTNKTNFDMITKYSANQVKSLMDLQEFKTLDPELKDKYQRYVVDKMAVTLIQKLNASKTDPMFSDKVLEDNVAKYTTTVNNLLQAGTATSTSDASTGTSTTTSTAPTLMNYPTMMIMDERIM